MLQRSVLANFGFPILAHTKKKSGMKPLIRTEVIKGPILPFRVRSLQNNLGLVGRTFLESGADRLHMNRHSRGRGAPNKCGNAPSFLREAIFRWPDIISDTHPSNLVPSKDNR